MKALYSILFFVDAVALITLCFLLFYTLDKENCSFYVTLIAGGIFICINVLVFVLLKYLKLPSHNNEVDKTFRL